MKKITSKLGKGFIAIVISGIFTLAIIQSCMPSQEYTCYCYDYDYGSEYFYGDFRSSSVAESWCDDYESSYDVCYLE